MIKHLIAQSATVDEQIQYQDDIGSYPYNAVLIEEVIYRNSKKIQNAKCLNCGKQVI